MKTPLPILMDCDPGLDDAISILLALASPELTLLGISTVVGNGPLQQTQENARRICELAGRPDLKVHGGCPRFMFKEKDSPQEKTAHTGADIHGDTGLGNCTLPAPTMPLQEKHGVNFIIDTVMNSPAPVVLTPTGPLTNVACALIMAPQIKKNISKIVLMGGSIGLGNITPTAEFNFYSDPHAARVVFSAGVPIVMMGLDVTRQVSTSPEWLAQLKSMNTTVSRAVVDMLSYYHRPDAILEPGVSGGVLHDPNVIGYLLKPDLYQGRHVHVEIDTSDSIQGGCSIVDWWGKRPAFSPNAFVVDRVDRDGFFELLTERLGRYS